MPRIDIAQTDVLESIRLRVKTQLNLDDSACFLVVESGKPPPFPPGADFFVTVGQGEGTFELEEQVEGNTTEYSVVTVTGFSRCTRLDASNDYQELMRNTSRGLLPVKKKILAALVGHDLLDGYGNSFLRQLLYAARAGIPQVDAEAGIAWVSIDFGVGFDWDLT